MKKQKEDSAMKILWGWAEPNHGKFLLSIILAVGGVICSMIPYFCAADIVCNMIRGEKSLASYSNVCIIAFIGYLGKVIFSNISTTVSHTATYNTLKDLRENIVKKLAKVPMGTILNTPSGQYKNTIVDRIEGMEPTFAHLIPEMTANILVPLFIMVYLFILDWRMALLSIVTLVIGLAIMSIGMKNYPVKWKGAVEAGKKMTDAVVEYIGGIEVVKAFSQSAGSYKKYSDAVNYNGNYYVEWMRENQKVMSSYNGILPSVLVCVLPFGFAFWRNGSLDINTFMSIIIFSLGLIGPIMAVFTFMDDLAILQTNVGEINSLLNSKELNHKNEYVNLKDESIEFYDVSFSYDEDKEILHKINLKINPGKMTAFVGPSGSGKSTIAKLIAGYFDVTNGYITLGGQRLNNIPLSQLSKKISYVSQDNYLFNRTIRENIRMGKPNASDEEVEEVARKRGCDSFIRKLDNGYDTIVGSGGSHLSGGERQRITIARAMLKDAPVVILDEATAYIDPENEALVQKAISALTVGKTLIVIAHRLSTIKDADKIVLVNMGNIEDEGTHEELLSKCDLYNDMWKKHIGAKDMEQEESVCMVH
ncbi:MAG TPA: ABC transporter ATP-binding protein [Clostridium sp.]|nr:ABC transporter ATP-binding protein [Clostridium sp.]